MAKEKEVKRVTRGMPYNADAETSLLGAILIDNDAANRLVSALKANDFYHAPNRIIFEAMKELLGSSTPIDTVTVSDRLELKGQLDEIGSISYLSELAETVPSAANSEHYLEIVKRDSLLRRIISAGNEITKCGYESEDGRSALASAEKAVYDISEEQGEKALVRADAAFGRALNEIGIMQSGKVSEKIIKTGYPCLDRKTRGLKPGTLTILAARPSVGKTALALNIAANVALDAGSRKNVAIFSLEMSSPELAKRMLAYLSGVSLSKMDIQGGLNDRELNKLRNAYSLFLNCGIYIDDYSMNGPADVLSKCRRLKRENGLDLVIVDYLQLMTNTDEKSRSNENRQEEVSKMSRKMKIFARELDCPIIILSQMSRGIEQRNDHRPLLSDLRESGSIEQDADIVSFLYNPSKYNAALPTNQVILEIAKNRSGATGSIVLEWTGETTTFKEIGELDARAEENSAPVEKNTVEKIRATAEKETAMKEVGGALPFGDSALPFGERLVAADNADDGHGDMHVFDEESEEQYTYDDNMPEDELPF